MKKLTIIILTTGLALALSCGDNLKGPSDGKAGDTNMPDASMCPGCPAPPALGAQIDRLGRPAINTVLNHGFDPTSAAGSAKDAYNADGSPGGWMQYVPTFMPNLAILDALDTGVTCNNGVCGATPGTTGCGNQVEYNGNLNGGGTPAPTSYQTLASVLADDELYLDTGKKICDLPNHQNYLGVEFNVLTQGAVTNTCGGRAPLNDVIDTTYTAIAIGTTGFNLTDFTPFFGDLVPPHTDVDDDVFPFLGPPTN